MTPYVSSADVSMHKNCFIDTFALYLYIDTVRLKNHLVRA